MEFFRRFCNKIQGLKPVLAMVAVQIISTGMTVAYKLAINDCMNLRILIAYRSIFATLCVVPIALYVERGARPKLTWTILFQSFLCGLFGFSLSQNLYIESMDLTSATFPAVMTNLIPAITFFMAVVFKLEILSLSSLEGKLKVGGTLLGISGAMLLIFYRGIEIPIWSTNFLNIKHHFRPVHGKKILGSMMSMGSCMSYSTWLIIQTKLSQSYPCYYSSTALVVSMASIQSIGFALCTVRDWSAWKLGNVRLISAIYSGVMASGVMMTLIAWCVKVRGPLFASVFSPVGLVLVALTGSVLLNEKLHLGCVISGVLIAIGLYFVLWGKAREMRRMSRLMPLTNPTDSEARSDAASTSTANDASNNAVVNNGEDASKDKAIIDMTEIQQVNK
ncbi:hypothetical protein MKX01_017270 [Papaver californicum]|nr:hypothetical protein MKX01_017270 [Papaver californicum]